MLLYRYHIRNQRKFGIEYFVSAMNLDRANSVTKKDPIRRSSPKNDSFYCQYSHLGNIFMFQEQSSDMHTD